MRKALLFLLTGGLVWACRVSSFVPAEMKATVVAGIAHTQTAVVALKSSPTALPFAVIPTPVATPEPTPEPLVLGGKEKLLLQVSKCVPAENPNCEINPLGVYLAQPDGSQQETVADKAVLLGVDLRGEQCLIRPITEDGFSSALVVVQLQDQTKKTISESFTTDYPCDVNRCGAVWLGDGKRVAFIMKAKNANFLDEKNIYLIQNDGTDQKQLTRLGVDSPPMFLYKTHTEERIFWEKDDQGIMGGTFSIKIDGAEGSALDLGLEVAFSPNGEQAAFQKKANELGYLTSLVAAKWDGSDEKTVFTSQEGDAVSHYVWSGDGKWLVFDVTRCSPDCVTKRYLWQSGMEQPRELSLPDGVLLHAPSWSPNGKFLLFVTYDPQERKYQYWASHIESGQFQPILSQLNLPLGVFVESITALP